MYKGLYTYAWDIADEGLESFVPRVRDAGLNTVTLAASYHAGKFLRPHGQSGKVYFPKDGTVYFQARPERYGHIRPIVNPLALEFDALSELEKAAPDVERVAWVVCCHNSALGEQHPEFVSRNAFGDPFIYSLCPAHPAVRDYVVNLVGDLAERHSLAGVVLETPGWLAYDHGYHHEFAMLPLDRWAKNLLGLCFSETTRRAAMVAGIDADRLQAKARELLERYFAADLAVPEAMATEWWLADIVADPEWTAFLNWRCRVVADLVAAVKSVVPATTWLAVIPTVRRPTAGSWLEGSDLAMLAEACDALEIPAYQASAEEVRIDAFDVRRRAGDDARLHFILRPSFPDLANGAETALAARHLKEAGASGLAFYNYGHMRLSGLDHIKSALSELEG